MSFDFNVNDFVIPLDLIGENYTEAHCLFNVGILGWNSVIQTSNMIYDTVVAELFIPNVSNGEFSRAYEARLKLEADYHNTIAVKILHRLWRGNRVDETTHRRTDAFVRKHSGKFNGAKGAIRNEGLIPSMIETSRIIVAGQRRFRHDDSGTVATVFINTACCHSGLVGVELESVEL